MTKIPSPADPNRVIVRYVDPLSVNDTELIKRMHRWLDQAEQARLARFSQPQLGHAFLISHALMRKTLADLSDCAPEALRFGSTERHKPVLLASDGAEPLHFNLTHTQGLAVLAVSTEPVGVDAEWLGRQVDTAQLAQRYFTSAEQTDIRSQPTAELRRHRFLLYWTLKEAYLKAQAWGIADNLQSVSFELKPAGDPEPQSIELHLNQSGLEPIVACRFHHWRPTAEHLISLATSTGLPTLPKIDCQAWRACV